MIVIAVLFGTELSRGLLELKSNAIEVRANSQFGVGAERCFVLAIGGAICITVL